MNGKINLTHKDKVIIKSALELYAEASMFLAPLKDTMELNEEIDKIMADLEIED